MLNLRPNLKSLPIDSKFCLAAKIEYPRKIIWIIYNLKILVFDFGQIKFSSLDSIEFNQ